MDGRDAIALTLGVASVFVGCRAGGVAGEHRLDPRLEQWGAELRLAEPWLSAQVCYAPCSDTGLCSPAPHEPESHDRLRALLEDLLSQGNEGTVDLHSRGLARLIEGSAASAARAVDDLRSALSERGRDAVLMSDLAAAHYQKSHLEGQSWDLIHALGWAERALAVDSQLKPALFNRALVLQRLALSRESSIAWRDFAKRHGPSQWTLEARARAAGAVTRPAAFRWREALARAQGAGEGADATEALADLVRGFPAATLDWTLSEVLDGWGEAVTLGPPDEAVRRLAQAKKTAAAYRANLQDSFLADAVTVLEATSPEAEGRALAQAHRLLARNWGLPRLENLGVAGSELREAREPFRKASSPMSLAADLQIETIRFLEGRFDEAAAGFRSIATAARRQRYRHILGRSEWLLGLYAMTQGRPLEAIRAYEASLATFCSLSDDENAASVEARLADVLRLMGNRDQAWEFRSAAISKVHALREPTRAHFVFGEAALAALELDEAEAARVFQLRALDLARRTGSAVELSGALRALAAIELRLDRVDQAASHLEEAAARASAAGTPGLEEIVRAKLLETRALVSRATDPEGALEDLSTAFDLSQGLNYRAQLPPLLLELAKTRIQTGQPGEALRDLERAIGLVEDEWEGIRDQREEFSEALWPPYFHDRRRFFDEAIGLLASQGRFALAFDYAEQARARDLLDLLQRPGVSPELFARAFSAPLRSTEIGDRLPKNSTLISTWLLPDRAVLWTIRRGSLSGRVVQIGRSAIDALVHKLDPSRPGAMTRAAHELEVLHELVEPPVAPADPDRNHLVIVPDGALHGVPFAAMKDARSGRLLVEDAVISVAPSATLFLASVERVLQPLMASGVLVAGNASSAAHRIAGLGPLPRVSDEVDRVAGLYPSARVLLGEAVTEPDFLRLARSSNVVHFAGHALVNDSRPGFAALLLAPSPNGQGDGVLYAYELLQQRLGATRLVVLSACNTQSSVAKQALGLGGIVRPLIGAGVSGVVANMWPIEDFAAEQVMTRFHRHYVHGAGAAEALAAAQRELLHGPDRLMRDPAHWSGFEVFGFAPSPYQRGERRTAWDS